MKKRVFTLEVESAAAGQTKSSNKNVNIKEQKNEAEKLGVMEINNSSSKKRIKKGNELGYEINKTAKPKKSVKSSVTKQDDYANFDLRAGKSKAVNSAGKADVASSGAGKVGATDNVAVKANAATNAMVAKVLKRAESVAKKNAGAKSVAAKSEAKKGANAKVAAVNGTIEKSEAEKSEAKKSANAKVAVVNSTIEKSEAEKSVTVKSEAAKGETTKSAVKSVAASAKTNSTTAEKVKKSECVSKKSAKGAKTGERCSKNSCAKSNENCSTAKSDAAAKSTKESQTPQVNPHGFMEFELGANDSTDFANDELTVSAFLEILGASDGRVANVDVFSDENAETKEPEDVVCTESKAVEAETLSADIDNENVCATIALDAMSCKTFVLDDEAEKIVSIARMGSLFDCVKNL